MGLDTYGGYDTLPIAASAIEAGTDGYFCTAKIGTRWVFRSPSGNAFWLKSVQGTATTYTINGLTTNKYGSSLNFYTHMNRRLLAAGFNTKGEYTHESGLPIGVYGSETGNTVKLPFIHLLGGWRNMVLNGTSGYQSTMFKSVLSEPVKDIIKGIAMAKGFASTLPDVYDPQAAAAMTAEIEYDDDTRYTAGLDTTPWIIGICIGDCDKFWGFKGPLYTYPFGSYAHPAMMVAVSNHTYTSAEYPSGFTGPWSDTENHSKTAWINFLKGRYQTGGVPDVSVLNTAWSTGGFYTSFDTTGAWGTGTGVIDEDGRHNVTDYEGGWFSSEIWENDGNATLQTDLNAFLKLFARKLTDVSVAAIRTRDTNHLIFGPDCTNSQGYPTDTNIVEAFRDGGINVLVSGYQPLLSPDVLDADEPYAGNMNGNKITYDACGLPMYCWTSLMAQADSWCHGMATAFGYPTLEETGNETQENRGTYYQNMLNTMLAATGTDGSQYCLGIDWWMWSDHMTEQGNQGFITPYDNLYDGSQCGATSVWDGYYWTVPELDRDSGASLGVTITTVGTAATFSGPHGLNPNDYIRITSGSYNNHTRKITATPANDTATLEYAFTADIGTGVNVSSCTPVATPWGDAMTGVMAAHADVDSLFAAPVGNIVLNVR